MISSLPAQGLGHRRLGTPKGRAHNAPRPYLPYRRMGSLPRHLQRNASRVSYLPPGAEFTHGLVASGNLSQRIRIVGQLEQGTVDPRPIFRATIAVISAAYAVEVLQWTTKPNALMPLDYDGPACSGSRASARINGESRYECCPGEIGPRKEPPSNQLRALRPG